jgi:hypothetical protein
MLECNSACDVGVAMVEGCFSWRQTNVSVESIASVEVLAYVSADCLLEKVSSSWVLVLVAR